MAEKKKIGHNYRMLQARYGREVLLRRPEDEEEPAVDLDEETVRLNELRERLLREEIALLASRRAGNGAAGRGAGAVMVMVAAVGAALRLL